MGNSSLDVEAFVRIYVDSAFASVPSDGLIPLEAFDEKVMTAVSLETGIPRDVVPYLHHPLHWALFNRNGQSPLELIQPLKMEGFAVRSLRVGYDWREETRKYVLDSYRTLLESKLRKFNISPQAT
ncbi:MAG: hypothetical protein PHH00_00015 [Candidatus Nanoarchaeia archaeon]|nr:hypothetical protein [Candidatus Nanoarchaeia archaeon]